MTRLEFESSLRAFVQRLAADRRNPAPQIRRNTLLFEGGWIDSLKVLDLIAFVESSLRTKIADEKISLEHFRTVQAITDSFWNGPHE